MERSTNCLFIGRVERDKEGRWFVLAESDQDQEEIFELILDEDVQEEGGNEALLRLEEDSGKGLEILRFFAQSLFGFILSILVAYALGGIKGCVCLLLGVAIHRMFTLHLPS